MIWGQVVRTTLAILAVAGLATAACSSNNQTSYWPVGLNMPSLASMDSGTTVPNATYGKPGEPQLDTARVNRLDTHLDPAKATLDCVLTDNTRAALAYADSYVQAKAADWVAIPSMGPAQETESDPRKVVDNTVRILSQSFKSARVVPALDQVDRSSGATPCLIDVEMKFAQSYYVDENSSVKIRVYYLSGAGDLLAENYGFGAATLTWGWPPHANARQATRVALASLSAELNADAH